MNAQSHFLGIGCAGWSIPRQHAGHFADKGTHLQRYAHRFDVAEINSSFHRSHLPITYARWAAVVPAHFRFSVKLPKSITHTRRLVNITEPLERVLEEIEPLGAHLGPLLVQLPPSLRFNRRVAGMFFETLRRRFGGQVVCEPRHRSWFESDAEQVLREARIARAATDPVLLPAAASPGGWPDPIYYRLHGSPQLYRSAYDESYLNTLAQRLTEHARSATVWCIFDNTALGEATLNALQLQTRLGLTQTRHVATSAVPG
jgi:uncharacterized protein YecE (DUF72 family)